MAISMQKLVFDSCQILIKGKYLRSIVIALIMTAVIYAVLIEPYKIEVHHVWIRDAYLGKVLENKIIIQLSDLHIKNIGKREQKVLNIIDKLNPDIIFLTGDYVKFKGNYAPALKFLSRLKAKIGIWAVMGDYDYSRSRSSCLFCHEKGRWKPVGNGPVRFLKDALDTVQFPAGSVLLGGVDGLDVDGKSPFLSGSDYLSVKNSAPMIILSHSPLFFDMIDDSQDVLVLAGDTHGGQIPLPSWLLKVMGYKKNALYSQGLFEKGQKKMFVTRGIGTSHFPIRLFRRPEVVVLHFKP